MEVTQGQLCISDKDYHNLKLIVNKEKGDKFISDNGIMRKMNLFERIFYSFSKGYRNNVNRDLRESIGLLTSHISNYHENTNVERFITRLFFEKMSHLSREIYTRDLNEVMLNKLLVKVSRADDSEHVKMAKLFAKMGNVQTLDGASHSFRIIKGSHHAEEPMTIGIFKPSSGETMAETNPKFMQRLMRRIAVMLPYWLTGSLIKTVGGQAYVNEAATKLIEEYIMDKYRNIKGINDALTITLVPSTSIVTMGIGMKEEEKGSFQLWIQDKHQNAEDYLDVRHRYQTKLKNIFKSDGDKFIQEDHFDLMVIIDYLTGNCDRHGKNWFILEDGSIKLIDGGWAMSPEHPESILAIELRNQYLWKKLKLADRPLTDNAKNLLRAIEDDKTGFENLKNGLLELYNRELPNSKFDNQQRVDRMVERLHVLFNKKDTHLCQIGAIRLKQDIGEINNEYHHS